jgi:hypothetical protein
MSSARHYRNQVLTSLAFQFPHGISSAHGEAPNQTLRLLCHLNCSFRPSKGHHSFNVLHSYACADVDPGKPSDFEVKQARICLPIHTSMEYPAIPDFLSEVKRHLARTRFLLYGLCLVYDLDAAIDLQGSSCWSTVVGSFDGASRLGGCEA